MCECQPAVREQESTAGTGVLMQRKKSAKTLEIFRNNMYTIYYILYILSIYTKQIRIYYNATACSSLNLPIFG